MSSDWLSHQLYQLEQTIYNVVEVRAFEPKDWTETLQLAEHLVEETKGIPSLHEKALKVWNSVKEICRTIELRAEIESEGQRERWLSEL